MNKFIIKTQLKHGLITIFDEWIGESTDKQGLKQNNCI